MSRSDTIRQAAYRVQVFRADGTVKTELQENAANAAGLPGHKVREFYKTVLLEAGESAVYQIRRPKKAKFDTWSVRRAS
jgi:hypothetical protein